MSFSNLKNETEIRTLKALLEREHWNRNENIFTGTGMRERERETGTDESRSRRTLVFVHMCDGLLDLKIKRKHI
jgi:hypothetical protein